MYVSATTRDGGAASRTVNTHFNWATDLLCWIRAIRTSSTYHLLGRTARTEEPQLTWFVIGAAARWTIVARRACGGCARSRGAVAASGAHSGHNAVTWTIPTSWTRCICRHTGSWAVRASRARSDVCGFNGRAVVSCRTRRGRAHSTSWTISAYWARDVGRHVHGRTVEPGRAGGHCTRATGWAVAANCACHGRSHPEVWTVLPNGAFDVAHCIGQTVTTRGARNASAQAHRRAVSTRLTWFGGSHGRGAVVASFRTLNHRAHPCCGAVTSRGARIGRGHCLERAILAGST